ncbi:MAG: DUF4382 domain-containing protein [Maribacter sp.]|nr:DUF4382 domain-containing protein [Maribacter sp.]
MKIKNLFIVLFVAVTFLYSCTESDDNGSDMGKLTVQITDAPFPHDLVAEANVTIYKIEGRFKSDEMEMDSEEAESGESDEDKEGYKFVTLMKEEIKLNLLDLTNGTTEQLADLEVPAGTYDLLRVYAKGINVVLVDSTTYDLKVPSGQQSGIKVFIKPGIEVRGGLTADLLLDFDVSRSFVPKGNRNDLSGIKGFNFKPVIKACNISTAGTLSGFIYTIEEEEKVGLEGAQIEIYAADTLNTTAFSDATGAYTVLGLTAGTYDVAVELDKYEMQTAEDVEITAANKTIVDFELSAIP